MTFRIHNLIQTTRYKQLSSRVTVSGLSPTCCLPFQLFRHTFLLMEGEESLLDSILDADNVEDMEDVDMVDVEEGELVENYQQAELGQHSSGDGDTVSQEPKSKSQKRRNKKRNKKKKVASGPGVLDINRFVLDTCRRLKERKSYLIWTAVGCLGVPAVSDLVKEVDAIQACGGQMTSDGGRYRNGGGILWNILRKRDPNVYKEIMKKGREFEKQFKPPDLRKAANQSKQGLSEAEAEAEVEGVKEEVGRSEGQNGELDIEERQVKKRPVHERIRVPVSYDDLLEVEDPKEEANE
ncbi:unnamed protein product [Lactuca saligna]|uniref:Phosphorylated adapter RNA export protein n=1 Tax=Lactuca saligna TaxID=75948 RepID=A0AA35ZB72_LACSI|nr:unnamed protein product [Lactuca saligna]